MPLELLTFVMTAAIAIVMAGVVMLHRNPLICALSLVVNLLAVAVLFLLLDAQFMAALQVIIYAGAIMVLIVFVIMLLALPREPSPLRSPRSSPILAFLGAAALLVALVRGIASLGPLERYPVAPGFGNAAWVADAMFGTWFYPFEIISLVLIAAMAGAILLAKKEI